MDEFKEFGTKEETRKEQEKEAIKEVPKEEIKEYPKRTKNGNSFETLKIILFALFFIFIAVSVIWTNVNLNKIAEKSNTINVQASNPPNVSVAPIINVYSNVTLPQNLTNSINQIGLGIEELLNESNETNSS